VLLVSVLSGCYHKEMETVIPLGMWWMSIKPPAAASKDFKDGFWDGCETTLAENGWGPWKSFHSLQYDGYRMVDSEDYVKGWHTGNEICVYYHDHRVT